MTSRDRIPEHPGELILLDYLVGQLPNETKDQVRRHVGACRACRQTMQDLSAIVEDFDRLPLVAIPHDSPRGIRPPAGRKSRLRTILPGALVLAIALAASIVVGVFRDRPATPAPYRTVRVSLDETQPAASLEAKLPLGLSGYKVAVDADDDHTLYLIVPDTQVNALADGLAAGGAGGTFAVVVVGAGAHAPSLANPAATGI